MGQQIVVISLEDYENRRDEIAKQLFDAAKDVGFFYISGHGIPQEEIDAAFAAGRGFLEQSEDVKQKECSFNPVRYLGWRGLDEAETVTGNRLWEGLTLGRWGMLGYDVKQQRFLGEEWPESQGPEFRKTVKEFQAKCHDVSVKILKSLFRGLGWDESHIDDAFELDSEQNPTFMGWNHYPGITQEQIEALGTESGKIPPRLHAHADQGAVTILFLRDGDVGLEIAPDAEEENLELIEEAGNSWNRVPVAHQWIPLDPKPGCLSVNIGDCLTRWTDGIFKSTIHRVRAPQEGEPTGPRYSIPYFIFPKLNYVIQGPNKRWGPITSFELISEPGYAFEAQKDSDKSWQQAAYTDETTCLTEPAQG